MLGDIIKKERIKKGLTQEELSKVLGVSPSTIGMYEQNRRQPDPESIVKLANYFGVSSDYLLGVTSSKHPNNVISDALKEDEELFEFWNDLKEREELKLLFKQTRELDKTTIQQVMRIIKAIEDEESQI